MNDPYTEGYAAYEDDWDEDDNPYELNSDDQLAWLEGWADARDESGDDWCDR